MSGATISIKRDFCPRYRGENLQYLVVVVGLLVMLAVNLWGKETEAVNSVLSSVILGGLWGALQRQGGRKDAGKRRDENDETNS